MDITFPHSNNLSGIHSVSCQFLASSLPKSAFKFHNYQITLLFRIFSSWLSHLREDTLNLIRNYYSDNESKHRFTLHWKNTLTSTWKILAPQFQINLINLTHVILSDNTSCYINNTIFIFNAIIHHVPFTGLVEMFSVKETSHLLSEFKQWLKFNILIVSVSPFSQSHFYFSSICLPDI